MRKRDESRSRTLHLLCVTVLGTLTLLVACAGDKGDDPNSLNGGVVRLAIATVPDDVSCLRVTASSATRTVVSDIDTVPGDSVNETLRGLPVGDVNFVGDAYGVPCPDVVPGIEPTWLGVPVSAFVTNTPSDVQLTLRRNGRANVSVDFDDELVNGCAAGEVLCPDGTCAPDTTACGGCAAVCPDGTCVSDPNLCNCPVVCPDGTCVNDPAACGCPNGEVLCPDGTCAPDTTQCNNCSVVCPDGSCVNDPALCCSVICPDGTCASDPALCCPIVCPDGTCTTDPAQCCSVICPDGTCASDPTQCNCTVVCPDGTCVSDPAQCSLCPPDLFDCGNGQCVTDPIQCGCPNGGVTCPDGTCAQDPATCGVFACPPPDVACADGTCAPDVSVCP